MSRYQYKQGIHNYEDAEASIRAMLRSGEITKDDKPKIRPYKIDRWTTRYAIDLLRH